MKYSYTAIKEGKTINGTVEASSEPAVLSLLEHQGVKPLLIKVEKGKTAFFHSLKKGHKRVKLHDLVIFTRQLSTMISAGVPLTRALATLQAQTTNKYFKEVVNSVAKDVESGQPLSSAFAKYPAVFSDVYVNMVSAGETGGILDDILKRVAAQVEREASMRKKIKSAMMYPTVILTITVIAFFGIMIFIIPRIAAILKDLGGPNAKLPVYTRALLSISDFFRAHAIVMVVLIALGVFLLRRYIMTPKGKLAFHKLLLKIPVVNTIILKVAIARFSRTFASLMSAGVGVLDALEVTGGAIGNKVIEAELKEAAKEVKNGKQLSEPLSTSPHFPAIVSQMLAVGEETGQIDTVLIKVADFYEEEVDVLIDGLTSIIEPVMIIVLGSMVGLIAASVMGPIASLSQNVGNGN